jgi:hypothetical protein
MNKLFIIVIGTIIGWTLVGAIYELGLRYA